jgi:DNA-binding LytR/AlgR family response regulator
VIRLRLTLAAMAALLGGEPFARVHRSALVNTERVQEIVRGQKGASVSLLGGERIRVSRAGYRRLMASVGERVAAEGGRDGDFAETR